ncbi:MAG: WD40 repeat domain-containing protein [Chloroflexota bacterium]
MSTKDRKPAWKKSAAKKTAKEQVSAKPAVENKQAEAEPVKSAAAEPAENSSVKVSETKPQTEKIPIKIFGYDIKKLGVASLLIAFLGALPSIIGVVADSISIFDRMSALPTPTFGYIFVVPPTTQPQNNPSNNPSSPSASDPNAPVVVAQDLPLYEFRGNEFTVEQVQCMTPTVIPVSGAYNVAFFPGGQTLAVQVGDGESQIGIWDLQKNSLQGSLTSGILLTQSPYGPLYLVYDYDETYVFLAKDGSTIYTVPNENDEQPYGFAVSHDGRKMAFGYENGNVIVWDITTGESFTLFGSSFIVSNIVFSNDDSLIATGTDQAPFYIWDAVTHSMKTKIDVSSSYSFAFSPNGQAVIYRAYTKDASAQYIYSYDLESGETTQLVGSSEIWYNEESVRAFYSADQRVLVNGVAFWKTPENTALRNLKDHAGQPGYMVTGSFEGDKLISASIDEIIVWDLTCSKVTLPQQTVQAQFEPITKNNLNRLQIAQTFEDAELGPFASKSDRFVMGKKVYSLNTMKPVADFTNDVNFRYSGTGVDISPDGKYLVSWDYENVLNVWDIDNVFLLPDVEGCSYYSIFLPDGRLLAINVKDQICVWDDLNAPPKMSEFQEGYGTPITPMEETGYSDIVILPSGTYQVARNYNDEGKYALADLFAGNPTPKYIFPESFTWEVFSPKGTFLAGNCSKIYATCIYRVASQSLLFSFEDPVSPYAFSADEELFAIYIYSDNQNKIQVYDTDTWQLQTEIDPPVNYSVDTLRFSPDGHYLAVGEISKTWFWSVDGK